jgi:hypothetical protein
VPWCCSMNSSVPHSRKGQSGVRAIYYDFKEPRRVLAGPNPARTPYAGTQAWALKRSSTGVPAMIVVVAAIVEIPMLVITSKI